jgi:hypothetical protein
MSGNTKASPRERVWVPTAEVRAGDLLAHKLSDTPWTYTPVTGWEDRTLHLGGRQGDVVQRRFTVTGAPWWVGPGDRTHDLAGRALIRARPGEPAQYDPEPVPEKAAPVTRLVMGDDYYGYRMPVPSRFSGDLLPSLDDRWAVLESIGIPRRDGVTPLAAWRDAVADETGVPRTELDPAQGGRFDGGFTPAHVRQFMFYLA